MTDQFPPEVGGTTQPGGFGGTPQPGGRQETGGPSRTPRSEIGPAVSANRKKEPVLLLDLSTSMDWSAYDDNGRAVAVAGVGPAGSNMSAELKGIVVVESIDGAIDVARLAARDSVLEPPDLVERGDVETVAGRRHAHAPAEGALEDRDR